jgi:hypothetical protein
MKKTVTLPAHICHNQFGIDRETFESCVRGKPLEVKSKSGEYYQVWVRGEVYSLHEKDLKSK